MTTKRRLTKTERRDRRDVASLALTALSTGLSMASLLLVLNKKRSDDDKDGILYSEAIGPFKPLK